MSMSGVFDDLSTLQDKEQNYLGSAKVPLHKIEFQDDDNAANLARPLDRKNVLRLISIFKLEGCRRLEDSNRVTAILDAETLRSAHARGSSPSRSGEPPRIYPELPIECLHGRHRIAAASSFLKLDDKWWTVDFYSKGASSLPV